MPFEMAYAFYSIFLTVLICIYFDILTLIQFIWYLLKTILNSWYFSFPFPALEYNDLFTSLGHFDLFLDQSSYSVGEINIALRCYSLQKNWEYMTIQTRNQKTNDFEAFVRLNTSGVYLEIKGTSIHGLSIVQLKRPRKEIICPTVFWFH